MSSPLKGGEVSLSDELEALVGSQRCVTCEWCASRTTDEQTRLTAQMAALKAATRKDKYGQYADLHEVCTRYGLQTDLMAFRYHCRTHVA
jgi:hypothetical protein